jgi:hypothetical protein
MELIYIVFGIMISILFILLGITFHSISKEKNIELIKEKELRHCLMKDKELLKILIKKIE